MVEHLDPHMRQTDAFSWYMERDPLLRSTVVAVMVFDSRAGSDPAAGSARARQPHRAGPAPPSRRASDAARAAALGG